jgi:hypothetical protein
MVALEGNLSLCISPPPRPPPIFLRVPSNASSKITQSRQGPATHVTHTQRSLFFCLADSSFFCMSRTKRARLGGGGAVDPSPARTWTVGTCRAFSTEPSTYWTDGPPTEPGSRYKNTMGRADSRLLAASTSRLCSIAGAATGSIHSSWNT